MGVGKEGAREAAGETALAEAEAGLSCGQPPLLSQGGMHRSPSRPVIWALTSSGRQLRERRMQKAGEPPILILAAVPASVAAAGTD